MSDIESFKDSESAEVQNGSTKKFLEDSGFLSVENKVYAPTGGMVPIKTADGAGTGSDIIPGQYIVTLKDKPAGEQSFKEPEDAVGDVMTRAGVSPRTSPDLQVYEHALSGFAAKLTPQQLERLQNDPDVAAIEPDRVVVLGQNKPGVPSLSPSKEVPNGINRIEGRLSKTATTQAAVDVDIAVIDTGINLKHSDLNVVGNVSFVEGTTTGDDDQGHGSHVAGTIAAKDNGKGVTGVAPGARLWAVKVLGSDGRGSLSSVVAGIDFVTKNADKIEVANMSLGIPSKSEAINRAIDAAVDAGVSFAVAAGNASSDAQNDTPGSHPKVLAVSAIADNDGVGGGKGGPVDWEWSREFGKDMDDSFATKFSNFGSVVRIAAPGVSVESTWKANGANTDTYNMISGTSMASPHVAGALGLVKAKHPELKPADVYKTVLEAAKPQDDPQYGFKGDPDNFKEPILNVAKL